MKTVALCCIAALAVLLMASCGPYQAGVVGGMYFYYGGSGLSGLMRITGAGTVEPIPPSGKVIILAPDGGNLDLYYYAPYVEGKNEVMEQWYVDDRLVKEEKRESRRNFSGFTFENKSDGDHDVILVVSWAYTGGNRSAGTTSYKVRVRTGH